MTANKLRQSTFFITLLSTIPHLFCCVIPVVAAIIAVGSTAGLGATLASNALYNWIDAYHMTFLKIAIFGVLLSGVLNLIAYRMACKEACCAGHVCAPKKTKAFRLFIISFVLLLLDLSWFATEKYVLNLHNHDHNHGHAHHEEHHPEHDAHDDHHGHDDHHAH